MHFAYFPYFITIYIFSLCFVLFRFSLPLTLTMMHLCIVFNTHLLTVYLGWKEVKVCYSVCLTYTYTAYVDISKDLNLYINYYGLYIFIFLNLVTLHMACRHCNTSHGNSSLAISGQRLLGFDVPIKFQLYLECISLFNVKITPILSNYKSPALHCILLIKYVQTVYSR